MPGERKPKSPGTDFEREQRYQGRAQYSGGQAAHLRSSDRESESHRSFFWSVAE